MNRYRSNFIGAFDPTYAIEMGQVNASICEALLRTGIAKHSVVHGCNLPTHRSDQVGFDCPLNF